MLVGRVHMLSGMIVAFSSKVSQYFAARVTSRDGHGILMNSGSGDYSRGKSPHSWVGSAQVLSEYRKSRSPVKYGQSWVASGLLTTCKSAGGGAKRSV